ncbi:hypothetical protein QR685DRAFT_36683 [Neurospora intermedia]|uniref:Uncharacterized protein n=1 Tax=Neurospora intermedia TaxID=5142 RepID=A0ABR3DS68_NEUIN
MDARQFWQQTGPRILRVSRSLTARFRAMGYRSWHAFRISNIGGLPGHLDGGWHPMKIASSCNAMPCSVYYLFAPDAAPIIGMVQARSFCRHHPSASQSSTGTRNYYMSSTGFILEARTFLSGMELASPLPTTYLGPTRRDW